MMAAFVEESTVPVAELQGAVRTFVHRTAGVRVALCDVAGPLCSAFVVVPTVAADDRGLPHTLEHLVFCGSRAVPHRGYLDHLALRCLTSGTNAWTADDHTAYTATTAGPVGMYRLLPVFLDHILHPTLRQTQFVTEVYHVDGDGREQGVVFAEMNGRENTEADLLDHALRGLLFPGTPFAHDCGGRTEAIATLTNDAIQEYHARFYRPDRLTVIVCGQIDAARLLEAVASVDFGGPPAAPEAAPRSPPPTSSDLAPPAVLSRVVPFPSPQDDLASISFGWRGPSYDDVETILGLEVLLRYLMETAASPIYQRFVERAVPLASAAEYEFKLFPITGLLLTFYGVPVVEDDDDDNDDRDGSGDDDGDGSESGDEDEEEEGENDDDDDEGDDDDDDEDEAELVGLVEPGRLQELLLATLQGVHDRDLTDGTPVMVAAVRRHRLKYLESLEDESADVIAGTLIQEFLHGRQAANGASAAPLGERLSRVGPALDRLEHEPAGFWRSLLHRWFLSTKPVEVIMRPDPDLAARRAAEGDASLAARQAALGPDGLKARAAELDAAVADNAVNLSAELLASMPPLPDTSTIPRLASHIVYHWGGKWPAVDAAAVTAGHHVVGVRATRDHAGAVAAFTALAGHAAAASANAMDNEAAAPTLAVLDDAGDPTPPATNGAEGRSRRAARPPTRPKPLPFPVQEVATVTHFVHVRLCLDAAAVPHALRPYLVLWQEVLLETDLSRPGQAPMNYREVVRRIHEDTLSLECGLGFGNETFSCSYLGDIFYLYGAAEPAKLQQLCEWMLSMLFHATFPAERLLAVAKNLLSDIAETVRDGEAMMDVVLVDQTEAPTSPLRDMSILRQRPFLRHVVAELASHDEARRRAVTGALYTVRHALLSSLGLAFAQVAHPLWSPTESAPVDTVAILTATWHRLHDAYRASLPPTATPASAAAQVKRARHGRRPAADAPAPALAVPQPRPADARPWPFPRQFYVAAAAEQALLVPIAGIDASYVTQLVACPLPLGSIEHAAVALLCELLSRTEGPLYMAVRGKGHAYGADVNYYRWAGQLAFVCREATAPDQALWSFYRVLEDVRANAAKAFTPFEMDTARAALIYRSFAGRSSAGQNTMRALQQALTGVWSAWVDDPFAQAVADVTAADLHLALERHLARFLTPSDPVHGGRVTVVTTNAQKVDAVLTAFRSGPFPLAMAVHDLKKPPPAAAL